MVLPVATTIRQWLIIAAVDRLRYGTEILHRMAALHPSASPGDGLENLLRNGLSSLERDLGQDSEDAPAAVHRARRRIKSLRALLRMIRVAVGDEAFHHGNDALREASHALASARRMGAMVESAEKLKADGAWQMSTECCRNDLVAHNDFFHQLAIDRAYPI